MTALQDTDIEIRSLTKVFGNAPRAILRLVEDGVGKDELRDAHGHLLGLRDINLTIPQGSIQVIIGLSGSGKSTLIRHINRLVDPTGGEVLVGGVDVLALNADELRRFRRQYVSMVFQGFALFPHMTVRQNISYPLDVQGVSPAERDERTGQWIERVGLTGYEDAHPDQLSGGMQQRVGIARALVTDAAILLMDEPFSALDPVIRADMRKLLLELQGEMGKTIVFVTHDLEEALEIGDRIAILRDGEIVQNADAQEIVLRPADDYVAELTSKMNRGRILRVGAVMEPINESLDGLPACPMDMTLQKALSLVTSYPDQEAPVGGPDGETVGSISVLRILIAMAGGRYSVPDSGSA